MLLQPKLSLFGFEILLTDQLLECVDDAEAPDGWTKWTIPSFEYIFVETENENTFPEVLRYMDENNITLVGAVHDFTCPESGKNYMFFPIRTI